MCSRTVNRQSRCKRMPRNEAGARQARSIYRTTLNADDNDTEVDERLVLGNGESAR